MLNVTYHLNSDISTETLAKASKITDKKEYSFATHNPPLDELKNACEPFQQYPNIIIIGNGGSRNNTYGFINALTSFRNDKKVYFLSTPEPDVIAVLKKHCQPDNTLIVPVSKSGTNVDALIPLAAFWNYPIFPVTGANHSVLQAMADRLGWSTALHPEIGGRYSARTSCAYIPAILAGLPIEDIDQGFVEMYQKCQQDEIDDNPALKLAAYFYDLDLKGYSEVFVSMYSKKLFAMFPILVQLVHESTGKDGQGQTLFGDQAPENQHHTGQRFFGGRKNVIGMYHTVAEQDNANDLISIPTELQDIPLRDDVLGLYNNTSFQQALTYDYQGNQQEAQEQGIPHVTLTIDKITPYSMGELLAFYQYFTVFSAKLRNQNPFDQPQVERSKQIAFELAK